MALRMSPEGKAYAAQGAKAAENCVARLELARNELSKVNGIGQEVLIKKLDGLIEKYSSIAQKLRKHG